MSNNRGMATSYLPYQLGQSHLLQPSAEDWLPEGHLAYFIADTVELLDLSAFHARYAKGGRRNQLFHPAMMVKVLVYRYATGVFSSRKLARRLHEDVALRVLASGNFPAHRTLSDFRALHLAELSALFEQVVKLARECGLVKLGTIAVDGTKVKANASRHKAMSYGRMQQAEAALKQQIAALLERARAADAAEADEPEQDLPAVIARREARLAAIEAAKARLEAQQREADTARGRHADDERRPRDRDGRPKNRGGGVDGLRRRQRAVAGDGGRGGAHVGGTVGAVPGRCGLSQRSGVGSTVEEAVRGDRHAGPGGPEARRH
jgi:transposase